MWFFCFIFLSYLLFLLSSLFYYFYICYPLCEIIVSLWYSYVCWFFNFCWYHHHCHFPCCCHFSFFWSVYEPSSLLLLSVYWFHMAFNLVKALSELELSRLYFPNSNNLEFLSCVIPSNRCFVCMYLFSLVLSHLFISVVGVIFCILDCLSLINLPSLFLCLVLLVIMFVKLVITWFNHDCVLSFRS